MDTKKNIEKDTYIAVSVFDGDKIISSGKSMKSVIEKADKTGEPYIISPVLEENTTYIL